MIQHHIYMDVAEGETEAFEALYREVFVPAIRAQEGFRGSTLLRRADNPLKYRISNEFDSEELRLKWVATPKHDDAWPRVAAVCTAFGNVGFTVIA